MRMLESHTTIQNTRNAITAWLSGSTRLGRLEEIKEQITERQARGQQIELFLKDLENVGVVKQFDDDLFLALVESIEVVRDTVMVRFRDGTEVEVQKDKD